MFSIKPPKSYAATASLLADIGKSNLPKMGKGRVRTGKTAKDRKSGSWKQRFENRQRPIRCTSSHNPSMGNDTRGYSFWRG